MPLRALIIDDEPAARSELRSLLEAHGEVSVLGEAATAPEAIELIKNVPYDVVFLDINMPKTSGLELAAELRSLDPAPAVVFVTAYSEHAVRAFDLEAADYLMKPVSESRLARCIERVKRQRKAPSHQAAPQPTLPRLFVDSGGKKVAIDYKDIYFFEANDDYARLYTESTSYLIQSPLKVLAEKLAGHNFLRVHRKYIVNMDKVAAVVPLSRSTFMLRLCDRNGTEIPVSKRRAREIKEALGI